MGYSKAVGGGGEMRGLKREERKCTECDSREVENAKHFLKRCRHGMERGGVHEENEDGSDRIG